jgi:hypothetical protein
VTADLVAFVRARLGEREELARRAQPGPWTYEPEGFTVRARHEVACRRRSTHPDDDPRRDSTPMLDVDGRHIAANDPAWVLADVAVKRAIVDAHSGDQEGDPAHECPQPEPSGPGNYTAYEVGCHTLRLLALPDASHPDYRPEWAP